MPAASDAQRVVSSLSLRQVNNSEVSLLVAVILQLIDRIGAQTLEGKNQCIPSVDGDFRGSLYQTSSHLLIFMATGLLAEVAALIHSTQFPWRDSQLRLITVRPLNKEVASPQSIPAEMAPPSRPTMP